MQVFCCLVINEDYMFTVHGIIVILTLKIKPVFSTISLMLLAILFQSTQENVRMNDLDIIHLMLLDE